FVRPDYWVVLDELQGRGSHRFDLMYHFAPDAALFVFGEEQRGEVECRVRSGPATLHMHMYASEQLRALAMCGELDPIQAWSSKRYGERQASPALMATLNCHAPVSVMSFLSPTSYAPVGRRVEVEGSNVVAAAVRHPRFEDTCVFSPGGTEVRLAHYSMR